MKEKKPTRRTQSAWDVSGKEATIGLRLDHVAKTMTLSASNGQQAFHFMNSKVETAREIGALIVRAAEIAERELKK